MPHTESLSMTNFQEETHIRLKDSDLEEGQVLPSSASLPSDDFKCMGDILHNQIQLASYEYNALQQHYHTLNRRHEDLHKLCSAYVNVICGSSPSEEHSISIGQLRAEAGCKGMRAKALEADVLKPIIREAGGLHALISQMETIQPLIKRVGGVQELEDLVSEMHLSQIGLHEVGGLQGLYNPKAEVKRLKEEHLDMRTKLEGPSGLAQKAAKYDRLVQVFGEVQAQREHVAPAGTVTVNPDRASLIASLPLEQDPYRDLYEGPQVKKPQSKTGSNGIPLGNPRTREQSNHQSSRQPSVKREPMDDTDMEDPTHKRPRTALGHPSALFQISMTQDHVDEQSDERHNQVPKYEAGLRGYMRY